MRCGHFLFEQVAIKGLRVAALFRFDKGSAGVFKFSLAGLPLPCVNPLFHRFFPESTVVRRVSSG